MSNEPNKQVASQGDDVNYVPYDRYGVGPPTTSDLYGKGWALIPASSNETPLARWKDLIARPTEDQIYQWQANLWPEIWLGVTGLLSGRFVLAFRGPDGEKTMRRLGLTPNRRNPSGDYQVDVHDPGWSVKTLRGKTARVFNETFPGMDVFGDGKVVGLLGESSRGDTNRSAITLTRSRISRIP